MKKLLGSFIALALASSAAVQAEVSGNIGYVSDYYFHGTNLGDGGVYAGLDYENSGFFAGAWGIDDAHAGNDGAEVDFYAGYGQDVSEELSWSVAYTRYTYTYTEAFEHEVGANISVSGFSFDYVSGEADPGYDGDTTEFQKYIANYSQGAYGVTVGAVRPEDSDSDYEWVEFSISGELVEGIEASFNFGRKKADGEDTDGYMYLDISKSFDLF